MRRDLSTKESSVKLASGDQLPLLGLGTWRLLGKECTQVVQEALQIGYQLIDTAHAYENHKAIGKALRKFPRESYFLTSKFTLDQIDLKKIPKGVEKACDTALKELGVDFLDLFLLHWPDHSKPLGEILLATQTLIQAGKIQNLGVSNCTTHHLRDILKAGVKVAVNQVEFHPYLYQKMLWEFCDKEKILLQSYRPLGKGALLSEPPFLSIAEKEKKTPAQIILRWLIQKKIPVVVKASSKAHLKENLAIFDFKLSGEEMAYLDGLHRDTRYCVVDAAEFEY